MDTLNLNPENAHQLFSVNGEVWKTITKKVVILIQPNDQIRGIRDLYANFSQKQELYQLSSQWFQILQNLVQSAKDLQSLNPLMEGITQNLKDHKSNTISSLRSKVSSLLQNQFIPKYNEAKVAISDLSKFSDIQNRADNYAVKAGFNLNLYYFLFRIAENYEADLWAKIESAASQAALAWDNLIGSLKSIEQELQMAGTTNLDFLASGKYASASDGWAKINGSIPAFIETLQHCFDYYQTDEWCYDSKSPKPPYGYAFSWEPDTSVKTQLTVLDAANRQMPYPLEFPATLAYNANYRTIGVSLGYIPMGPANYPPYPPFYAGFTVERAGLGYFYIGIMNAGYLFWDRNAKRIEFGQLPQLWRIFNVGNNKFLILNDSQGAIAMLVPKKMVSVDTFNENNPQFMSTLAEITLVIPKITGTNISHPGLWNLFWT